MFMAFTGQKEVKAAICLLNSMIHILTGLIRNASPSDSEKINYLPLTDDHIQNILPN